jgi:hypothetical protein
MEIDALPMDEAEAEKFRALWAGGAEMVPNQNG